MTVLTVNDLSKQFEDAMICEDFHWAFRGEKIAIVGRNGAGKTSMLQLFLDELRADDSEVEWIRDPDWLHAPRPP